MLQLAISVSRDSEEICQAQAPAGSISSENSSQEVISATHLSEYFYKNYNDTERILSGTQEILAAHVKLGNVQYRL